MNRNKLKTYAPRARRDFIQAVTDRAAQYGLTATKIEQMTEQGEVVLIGGRPFPKTVGAKRKKLEYCIKRHGFEQTMEAMAYTWFNRLVAIRFMELHGYLDQGFRVLSHPEGHTQPEILEHAQYVDLPGLDQQKVVALKLDGTKEEELYRLLLVAQCNALHEALPFLFESIDDETELLLPDNLLHSDSLIRNLVNEISDDDWREVEIIGWLYQFYISERMREVIGKVVASEDIPAATQLFTPNWIVKYLVQNTLGRQWVATYPQSALRQQMEYYIEPADQTPEVREKLKAITHTSLNPEELTLLDPACGSGHILAEAYDLFKEIYKERGYRVEDIPTLILQKNLFGLEIDDRAAQLSAFALMMKARADDRRIFDSEAKPNILAFDESQGMNAADITHALNSPINKEDLPSEFLFEEIEDADTPLLSKKALAVKGRVSQGDIASLLELFETAKTFGSLIQIPPTLAAKLPEIEERLNDVLTHGDLTHAPAHVIKPLLHQARLLTRQYDAVVANPPYMGAKFYSDELKRFVNREYKESKADLYSCFIQRNATAVRPNGLVGMITIPNWMFLSSFEELRQSLFDHQSIDTLIHNGRGVFGSDFGSCAFVIRNTNLPGYCGSYRRLFDKQGSVASNEDLQLRYHTASTFSPSQADLAKIPGIPVAYWISAAMRKVFSTFPPASEMFFSDGVTKTGDNDVFLRYCWELPDHHVADPERYRFHAKGGPFRKYVGNCDTMVAWDAESRDHFRSDYIARITPEYLWNAEGITWTDVTSAIASFRLLRRGHIAATAGPAVFPNENGVVLLNAFLAFLNSQVATCLLRVCNPTMHNNPQEILKLPFTIRGKDFELANERVSQLLQHHKIDWDSFETSWDFQGNPTVKHKAATVEASQQESDAEVLAYRNEVKKLEKENNRIFIESYGLEDELAPEVPDDQITLYRPDRAEDIKRLVSYGVGCMMGRYSLDRPGLIYAHGGNQGFDASHYKTFRADDDGIIPLLETDWGIRDDTANRIVEFLGVAWRKDHCEENLKFVADSLGSNNGDQPRDTIRRYLATGFYKHHLSMYKKRPIYWLFSSGKQRAFQCLVYLHRYNEGTLARMRTEYVIPLMGKMTARLEHLQGPADQKGQGGEIAAATSATVRRKLEKERDTVKKQIAELQEFDAKLRHYADLRISLDLDDGVKVNYGKFSDPEYGDILADVKAICGTKTED